MKTTTKNTTNKKDTSTKQLEGAGFKVILASHIPCNIMDYSSIREAMPMDGDGSSARELELNARMHFISSRKWRDFGVLVQAPQLKSNRTGEVDDSRYFEIIAGCCNSQLNGRFPCLVKSSSGIA